MHKLFVRAQRFGAAVLLGSASATALWAQEPQSPDLMFVFDASGSMWGQVDGTTKIEIARDVFKDLSQSWAGSDQAVGMIAYGHRRKGDCSDIELLERPSVEAAQSLAERVQGLVPRGKTPLSQAVRMAAEELKYTENAATVVLLSDGIETCNLDPCAVGAELERLGVNFTAHVIGFDIRSEADRAQLQCLAENTGGSYLDASDASSLSDALTKVTTANDAPAGTVPVVVRLEIAEGSVRPAFVTLKATHRETGEVIELGRLEGADQIINGVTIDLPEGPWIFKAEGDGGVGEAEVNLARDTENVYVPFAAEQGTFALLGATSFSKEDTITIRIKALTELQQNATYSIMLFPEGATDYDQSITHSYRFGSDAAVTEHNFYLWQLNLPAGAYEIIVMPGSYDLSENLGRFPITITEPGAGAVDVTVQAQFSDGREVTGPVNWSLFPEGANGDITQVSDGGAGVFEDMPLGSYDVSAMINTPNGPVIGEARITLSEGGNTHFAVEFVEPMSEVTMDQLKEPLSPGVEGALRLNGQTGPDAKVMFIGLDGQNTVSATIPTDGLVSIPPDLVPGGYRLHLVRDSGEDTFLDTIEVLPESAQHIGDHGGGEDASTMMSEEELAAEAGPQTPFFEVWKQCDGPTPCRVRDPRVDLEWVLPPVWATSEPFYYTTAGGAVSENPTVEMARLDRGEFMVVLNPRQWAAQLGPCEEIAQGQLCRDESEVALDLQDYEIIKSSFAGDLPKPEGWLPLGRSWTIMERGLDQYYGLLKIDEPAERAETTTGLISVTSELYLGIKNTDPVAVEFDLNWNNTPLVTDLFGRFEIDGEAYDIRLVRPSEWDGSLNVWRGEMSKNGVFLSVPIEIF